MLSEDYQKCTCELAKASLCLSFFSFTTTLHLGLFPAVNCLFFNPVVSPFSHNPVSLWACFSTSPPSHHPSSLSFHMLLSPLFPHLPSRQCSSLLFLPFFLLIPLFLSSVLATSMSFSSSSPTALPFLSPLFYTPRHLSLLPALSGISLWRWI